MSFYTDTDSELDKIIHAILIPNYKEELDGLRETLDVLASHPQARSSYDVSIPLVAPPTLTSRRFTFERIQALSSSNSAYRSTLQWKLASRA